MHVRVYAGAILIAWSGAIVMAQTQKVTTPEQLDKVMKSAGTASRNISKMTQSAAYAEAKKELVTLRQAVLDSQSFWIEHKKDDAVKLNKDALEKIDAFDKMLSAPTVDGPASIAAMKEMGQACGACHKQYRAQDADNNYILKPGVLDSK
jgi:cytochrome c556